MTVWILPVLLLVTTTALAVPLAYYIAWIMDGKYKAPAWLRWIEARVNTGPQSWKQYTVALLVFNTLMFGVGYLLLALQPLFPLAYNLGDNAKEWLSPTTVFNTAVSFFTNTNLQNYVGEVHFTYFSQIFFILFNMFLSASVGVCCLTGIIRALRGDRTIGNYYLDMWRVRRLHVPAARLPHVDPHAGRRRPHDAGALRPGDDARRGRQRPAADADHRPRPRRRR